MLIMYEQSERIFPIANFARSVFFLLCRRRFCLVYISDADKKKTSFCVKRYIGYASGKLYNNYSLTYNIVFKNKDYIGVRRMLTACIIAMTDF